MGGGGAILAILSEAADQDGNFDTLIPSLGQLVVVLLTFVFKLNIQTDERTDKRIHAKFNIDLAQWHVNNR